MLRVGHTLLPGSELARLESEIDRMVHGIGLGDRGCGTAP